MRGWRKGEKDAGAGQEEVRSVSMVAAHPWRVGPPGEPEMLPRWKPGLALPLLLFLGPLCPRSPGALAEPAPADDVVELLFSTERPVHLVSPAFLSFTIDANLDRKSTRLNSSH